jgi:uncharacterized protein YyaL (SSP411 family)
MNTHSENRKIKGSVIRSKGLLLFIACCPILLFSACVQKKGQSSDQTIHEQKDTLVLNQLADAKSPYLRQHADNPVNWHEWGPEALKKASEENKPLLISIGYAACHWCHVMEHESFMDSSVATLMNENFIPIKIDREERPDIDQIYMNAVQLISGNGGWPLNAFALPDGRPYYAGTYYPTDQWKEVLQQMSDVYHNQYQKVEQQAELLTQSIRTEDVITVAGDSTIVYNKERYKAIFINWQSMIDYKKGGYSRSPKFPLPVGWEFLLQYHYLTGDDQALQAVTTTLDEMAKGGIYDQVGGGFARYSTDAEWFAPHFEKMLYDNGQLVSLYAHAYKVTKNEAYAAVVRETLAFVEREMTSHEGGFYASLNADSEGEEGKFYVWTKEEIENTLDPETSKLIIAYYNITSSGNWEDDDNILYRDKAKNDFAQKSDLSIVEWNRILSQAKAQLLSKRSERIRPSTDDKILTSWNALMIVGYIDAYLALGDKAYLQTAIANAKFLEQNMIMPDGSLWRNYKEGDANISAFLDDYALLADAYIQLYQATFDMHWLDLSKKLTDYAIDHFRNDDSGMFFYTSDLSENLIARKMEITDNVIPASNSIMANVLYKLGLYYYDKTYTSMTQTMLNHVQEDLSQGGPYYANWARLLGMMAYEPFEVAIMGTQASSLSLAMQKSYLPTAIYMGGTLENLPSLENKMIQGEGTIYVCKHRVCKLPVTDVEAALAQMDAWK